MVSSEVAAVGIAVPIEQRRRAAEMGQRHLAHGANASLSADAGRRIDAQQLARLQHVGVVAGDEVDDRHLRAARRRAATACRRPRARRSARSSAPAGSDMQMLPPTVAAFQILNDARNAVAALVGTAARPSIPAGASKSMQLDDPAGRGDLQPGRRRRSSAGQPSCSRSISVSVATCGSENSQVPPASQA